MIVKVFSILTLVLLLSSTGCGFAIYFGGEKFQDAIKGHMVLGSVTLVVSIIAIVLLFTSP